MGSKKKSRRGAGAQSGSLPTLEAPPAAAPADAPPAPEPAPAQAPPAPAPEDRERAAAQTEVDHARAAASDARQAVEVAQGQLERLEAEATGRDHALAVAEANLARLMRAADETLIEIARAGMMACYRTSGPAALGEPVYLIRNEVSGSVYPSDLPPISLPQAASVARDAADLYAREPWEGEALKKLAEAIEERAAHES